MHQVKRLGLLAVASLGLLAAPASAQRPSVAVSPSPGSRVASPQTQIAFRGVPAGALGTIRVTGSRSGAHRGVVKSDSDGDGGSFIPRTGFRAGETVTVSTSLNVLGARGGVFRFSVASPAGPLSSGQPVYVRRTPGSVWSFHSRPDLAPAAVRLLSGASAGGADVFLTPQFGPVQNGLEILDPSGQLIWFDRIRAGNKAANLQVQQYHGAPVLTWWEGYTNNGMGIGVDRIFDTTYRQVGVVRAANGLTADLHEFGITHGGTALITAVFPVYWDATSVHGLKREIVFDSVIQEIDIPTGLVLYQWDSLDHVGLGDSYQPAPAENRKVGFRNPYDYFHINSIQLDGDGSLIVAARNTWAIYKLDHRTGAVVWTLGGRRSSFRMGAGAGFAFEHDALSQSPGDSLVTVFDDGAGLPNVHKQSRGLQLALDFKHHSASVARQWLHSPSLLSQFEGNVQPLPDGGQFIGWGQEPYFTQYDSSGQQIFDGRFVSNTSSYRAYRFAWSATPATRPALSVSASGSSMTLFASWNGATTVASWRVLAGASAATMQPLTSAAKTSFETAVSVPRAPYTAVQALDSSGRPLATSATVHVS